tara:strand:- start:99 stop:599 length:501 start_codon:yes stop_codon:yes gene_type:complete
MKNSTNSLINEIINEHDCPFTNSEVHGFYTGLVLSSLQKHELENKILSFMDIDNLALNKSNQLLEEIKSDIKKNELSQFRDKGDYDTTCISITEWMYYFLISFQISEEAKKNDPRTLEILDIFDEISQLNQKYVADSNDEINKESLDDINEFIEKSIQYIFNKNYD